MWLVLGQFDNVRHINPDTFVHGMYINERHVSGFYIYLSNHPDASTFFLESSWKWKSAIFRHIQTN